MTVYKDITKPDQHTYGSLDEELDAIWDAILALQDMLNRIKQEQKNEKDCKA